MRTVKSGALFTFILEFAILLLLFVVFVEYLMLLRILDILSGWFSAGVIQGQKYLFLLAIVAVMKDVELDGS
jgi:hypothetical protein